MKERIIKEKKNLQTIQMVQKEEEKDRPIYLIGESNIEKPTEKY